MSLIVTAANQKGRYKWDSTAAAESGNYIMDFNFSNDHKVYRNGRNY